MSNCQTVKFLWYKTTLFYVRSYAPCSLNYFPLLPASCTFMHHAPDSLAVLAPILPAP